MATTHHIAVHEAAHAVVAWRFDLLPEDSELTINEGSDQELSWLGKVGTSNPRASHDCDFRYGDNLNLLGLTEAEAEAALKEEAQKLALYREEVEREVMACMAGWEASRMLDPDAGPEEGDHDYRLATQAIEELIESRNEDGILEEQAQAYWNWLQARTRLVLKAKWDRVLAVASLLEERGTITGAEAADAIRRAGSAAALWYDGTEG